MIFQQVSSEDISLNEATKFHGVALSINHLVDDFTYGYVFPLIGHIVAETDVTSLQLIVQLLLQTHPTFGQPLMLTGVPAHLL